jgi:hypothetical protein
MSEQLLFGGAFSVVLPDNRDDLRSVFMIPLNGNNTFINNSNEA